MSIEHDAPCHAVSGRHHPSFVDDTAATEVSSSVLQRHLPRPAVWNRLNTTDHPHADTWRDRRSAASDYARRHSDTITITIAVVPVWFFNHNIATS